MGGMHKKTKRRTLSNRRMKRPNQRIPRLKRLKRAGARAGLRRVSRVIVMRAYDAGMRAARHHPLPGGQEPIRWMNRCWNDWLAAKAVSFPSWPAYHEASRAFSDGFAKTSGIRLNRPVLLPTRQKVGIVLTAMNEEQSIPEVLKQLERLPADEAVFVVNGSTDQTFWYARLLTQGIVVHYPKALGHDVGRAIGAKLADADIVLFLDGDLPLQAEQLVPFIDAVAKGADVALNNISPYIHHFAGRDPVTICKEMLNRSMGRPDLQANSLTAVPHALSRKAIETIGAAGLMVPPKAQAIALRSGLKFSCPTSVDVISKNRIRDRNTGRDNPVSRMIMGDHLEALDYLFRTDGARLVKTDRIRKRGVLGRASS